MTALIHAARAVTWGLLAACAIVAVFDGNAVGLFLVLAYFALIGALVLGIRARARRARMRGRP